MRILLVRHGESMGNVDVDVHRTMADHAIPLSDRGRAQAVATGEWLNDYFGDEEGLVPLRLWQSPYKRTRETADGLIAGIDERWIESRREHILLCEQQFGLFDGVPDDELPKRYPNEHEHYAKQEAFEGRFWARMPLGESRFDVATRVHQAFGTFHRDNDDHGISNIIVVCHGVTLRAFTMMWLHRTPEWFESEPNPKNCAVRLIEHGEDKGYVFPGFKRGEDP
jgi:2,3-bisphosphoglycerate-dependent phosphoglycerate mutase